MARLKLSLLIALIAKMDEIGGMAYLAQKTPWSPTFLSVCVLKRLTKQLGLAEGSHGLVIYSYGMVGGGGGGADKEKDTEKCSFFGPHYNPYGVRTESCENCIT